MLKRLMSSQESRKVGAWVLSAGSGRAAVGSSLTSSQEHVIQQACGVKLARQPCAAWWIFRQARLKGIMQR